MLYASLDSLLRGTLRPPEGNPDSLSMGVPSLVGGAVRGPGRM